MRYLFVAFNIMILSLGAWGSGGCGGTGESTEVASRSDYQGTYELRDENCLGGAIQSFVINDRNNTLTITDPGDTLFSEGDLFETLETSIEGNPVIVSDELDCIAGLIESDAKADEVSTNTSLNAQSGDLLVVCSDTSADGSCSLIFARTSTDI